MGGSRTLPIRLIAQNTFTQLRSSGALRSQILKARKPLRTLIASDRTCESWTTNLSGLAEVALSYSGCHDGQGSPVTAAMKETDSVNSSPQANTVHPDAPAATEPEYLTGFKLAVSRNRIALTYALMYEYYMSTI